MDLYIGQIHLFKKVYHFNKKIRESAYLCAKGHEWQFRKLKALFAKGYSDNRYAEKDSREDVTDSQPESEKNDPDDVSNRASCSFAGLYLFSEGEKWKSGNLKALHTKRDADNGYTA